MASAHVLETLENKLRKLPDNRLREVTDFVDSLLLRAGGAPGVHRFSDLCGTLSDGDAQAMISAIEEACERIDSDEWGAISAKQGTRTPRKR